MMNHRQKYDVLTTIRTVLCLLVYRIEISESMQPIMWLSEVIAVEVKNTLVPHNVFFTLHKPSVYLTKLLYIYIWGNALMQR